jgi:cytochrome d ubiquinol oxidase subunit II
VPTLDLPSAWFLIVGVLLVGYAVLDGFDLGVGMLHLFVARTDVERRTVLNAIGPVWDGNEVWLLTAGGALFAAFPPVYATVFSGFYLALILLLVALIFRAVSLEFRSKEAGARWRRAWDMAFAIGSFLPALLFGVALANVMRGLPLGADGEYRGGLLGMLDPFTIIVGVLAVTMLAVHGALWLTLRTEGAVQARARRAATLVWPVFVGLWAVATAAAWAWAPSLFDPFAGAHANALAWVAPLVFVAATVASRRLAARPEHEARAFVLSGVSIAALIGIVGEGLYPRLVPSTGGLAPDLTVANASSSDLALTVMLAVVLVGMPIVLAYTAFVYRSFRGKVRLDDHSY